jgi:hypothetical protein
MSLAKSFPLFRLGDVSTDEGTSSAANDTWAGQLQGFAIYDQRDRWPREVKDGVTVYLFDEHFGNFVHDGAQSSRAHSRAIARDRTVLQLFTMMYS